MTTPLHRLQSQARTILGLSSFLMGAALAAPPALAQSWQAGDAAAAQERESGAAADSDDEDQSSGGAARIRALDGTADIERYEDDSTDEVTVNAPLFAGDTVRTPSHGRTEIQLATGSLVRLDEDSRVSFMSVPGANGFEDEATLLQLSDGSVEIEVRGGAHRKGDFQIDTPAASVYLLSDGRYRIDIQDRQGGTRVSSYRGVAEVVGDEGSVILRSAHRTFVEDGAEPDEPRSFNTASYDGFDEWIADRGDGMRRAARAEDAVDDAQVPEPVRPYEGELSAYGRWTSVPTYGVVWVPSGVGPAWRPYSNGYWAYGPSGAFWVSHDPWGWAPYHYGRWNWYTGYGWVWAPGAVFSGAWVSWYYGPSYVGWAPLDYWNYPCWTGVGPGYGGFDFRSWNFVTYNNVYVRNVTKVYVNTTVVRNEVVKGTGVVVRRLVRLRPADVREQRVRPAIVLKKARSLGSAAVVDASLPRERAPKKAFRDSEREILKVAAEERRPGRAGKAGPAVGRSLPSAPAGGGPGVQRRPVRGGDDSPANGPRGIEGRKPRPGSGSPDRGSPGGRPVPHTHGAPARENSPAQDKRERRRGGLVGEAGGEPSAEGRAATPAARSAEGSPDRLRESSGDRPKARSADRSSDRTEDRSREGSGENGAAGRPDSSSSEDRGDREAGDSQGESARHPRGPRPGGSRRARGSSARNDADENHTKQPPAEPDSRKSESDARGARPDPRPVEPEAPERRAEAPESAAPRAESPRADRPRGETPRVAEPKPAPAKPAEAKPAPPKAAAPKAGEKHPKDSGSSDKDKDKDKDHKN